MGAMRAARDMGDNALAASYADASSRIVAPRHRERVTVAEPSSQGLRPRPTARSTRPKPLWQSQAGNTADEFGAKSAYRAAEAPLRRPTSKALRAARALTQSARRTRYWVARGFILMSDIYSAQGKGLRGPRISEALRENYPRRRDRYFHDDRRSPQQKDNENNESITIYCRDRRNAPCRRPTHRI